MKTPLPNIAAYLMLSLSALAAEPTLTLNVWPDQAPGETGQLAPEKTELFTTPLPKKQTTNVSRPTLEVFRPAREKTNGAAIVICPGGGFNVLMMDYEGEDCAVWLNTLGVTGIVLKYRVPARPNQPGYLAAFQDTQRALSVVRAKAMEWGLDPKRIGVMGFSAGAVASTLASTNFVQRSYEAVDAMDKVSSRPDFAVCVYPGGMTQDGKPIPEMHVSKDTPPTFITIAHNDSTENSVLFYLALKRAGVSAELHIYADGEHGFGMRPSSEPHATWIARLADWMNARGLMTPGPRG
jgi:acetyl esterase/lipase